MVTYVVVIKERTRDAAALAAYTPKAQAASEGHPMTIRAHKGRHHVIEGSEMESVTILEFPTFEEAERWYNSAPYQEALTDRLRGADYRSVIVEGCE